MMSATTQGLMVLSSEDIKEMQAMAIVDICHNFWQFRAWILYICLGAFSSYGTMSSCHQRMWKCQILAFLPFFAATATAWTLLWTEKLCPSKIHIFLFWSPNPPILDFPPSGTVRNKCLMFIQGTQSMVFSGSSQRRQRYLDFTIWVQSPLFWKLMKQRDLEHLNSLLVRVVVMAAVT